VTYRRPVWLKRALLSLQAQTHPDWVALVFDDSPTREGALVVQELNDERVVYRSNAVNLGAAANLDRAFQTAALAGGDYACVLEDDNWLLPDFLAANVRCLGQTGSSIMMRNQEIWTQVGEKFQPTGRTTRGDTFRDGPHSALQLRAHLFFHEGVSNGGLFWSTTAAGSLQVGAEVQITGVQEYCRTLAVRDPLWFDSTPLAVWSELQPSSVTRGAHSNRNFARAIQEIRIALVRHYGCSILDEARQMAERTHATSTLTRSLADLTLAQRRRCHLPITANSLKSYLRSKLVAHSLRPFLASVSL
jgi:glycosyltransferase involved in cell wall biosynthesis